MRLLKFAFVLMLAAIALSAGIVVTFVVGVTIVAVFVTRRLLRGSSPTARPSIGRPERATAEPAARRVTHPQRDGDVIDVAATEVPLDRSGR